MPQKPRFTREEIVDAAFALCRESGIGAVTARGVGQRLGATASPIFTIFSSMEEVKELVLEKTKHIFSEYIKAISQEEGCLIDYLVRWVAFARIEPNLYRLIVFGTQQCEDYHVELQLFFATEFHDMLDKMREEYQLQESDAKDIFNHMIIHSNGIAGFILAGNVDFTDTVVTYSITNVLISMIYMIKSRDESLAPELKEKLLSKTIANLKY